MSNQNCRCGKPTHPLYGGRCEDCWALDNRCLVDNRKRPHSAYVGIGDITDCRRISNDFRQVRR